MEDLCKRMPLLAGMILKSLDNHSLMICKESSIVLCQYLNEDKMVSVRKIKKYNSSFVEFQNVWKKILKKAPIKIVREFAILVQEFFKPRLPITDDTDVRNKRRSRQWHPLWIAALCGHLHLCKYITEKTGDAKPVGKNGGRATAKSGLLEIYEFLMVNLSNNACKVIIKDLYKEKIKLLEWMQAYITTYGCRKRTFG